MTARQEANDAEPKTRMLLDVAVARSVVLDLNDGEAGRTSNMHLHGSTGTGGPRGVLQQVGNCASDQGAVRMHHHRMGRAQLHLAIARRPGLLDDFSHDLVEIDSFVVHGGVQRVADHPAQPFGFG